MSVQEELRACLLMYPRIFPNKWSVYCHWFAVNGNGYEWSNGELVSMEEVSASELLAVEKAFKTYEKGLKDYESSHNYVKSIMGKHYLEDLKESILRTIRIQERMKECSPDGTALYPLCEYAKILNIPSNIQPDWLAAAKEFIYVALTDPGLKITSEDKHLLLKAKESIK